MPLSFLHPGMLAGAAAAVLPLLLHLWRRRRARREPFPDLTFLEELHRTRSRALGVRRWLLLLLRMLLILLVVLAAAGPRWGGVLRDGDGLLVLVDGSGSLSAAVDGEDRAAVAGRLVRSLLAAAPRDLPVQVVLAAGDGRPLLDDWLPAGTAAVVLPDPWPRTDAACDLPRALDLAAALVDRGPARRPRLVLVTDGQAPVAPADSLDAAAARLRRRGIDRLALRLVGNPVADGGVVRVAPLPGVMAPGRPLTIRAEVLPARPGQRFWLEVDGERVAEAEAPGNGKTETVTFALAAPATPGWHRAVVRTNPDRRPDNDAAPLLLPARRRADVLLLHGAASSPAGTGGWRFLAAALAPGDSTATPYRVHARRAAGVSAVDLAAADLVVLVDPPAPDPAWRDALRRYLERGGGLWLLCGERALGNDLRRTWLPLLGLPPAATWWESQAAGADQWIPSGVTHPVAAGWSADALATLGAVRWRRAWRLNAAPDSAVVPWRFAGGGPALLLGTVGRGRFALSPWDLAPAAGDLAASPMFPPLVQRVAGYLAAGRRAVVTVEAGRSVTLPLPAGGLAGRQDVLRLELTDPDGRVLWRRDVSPAWRGFGPAVETGPVWRSGFLTLTAGDSVLAAAVVREPPAEAADPTLDADGWRELLVPAGLRPAIGDGGQVDLAGRDLGPWAWLLAILILVAETAVARGDPENTA